QCSNGQTLGVWLTQRLATPLVKVLLSKLEQRVANVSSASEPRSYVQREQALQTWEQSAAHAKQISNVVEPVLLTVQAQSGLIEKVNVSIHASGVQLEFVTADVPPVKLAMSSMALGQWLAIMRAQFQRGVWNIPGVWSSWLDVALHPGRATS